jgi:predicted RNA binding protein YcfA (HicA-like mRNA interferase family)
VAELERAGFAFVHGGKGSHRKFRHSKFQGAIILCGQSGADAHQYQEKQVRNAIRNKPMKAQDQYLKFVRWEETVTLYVGYCPDLFPFGGVCHGTEEKEVYNQLCALVCEEVEELSRTGKELPVPSTRAMREAVPA